MSRFEYKVVPAPSKGTKAKGVKTAEARFSLTVEATLNELAAQGWEYVRAELLPSEERSGLTGSTTNWRNVLIFRRALDAPSSAILPHVEDTPAPRPVVIAEDPASESAVDLPPLSAVQDDDHSGAPEVTADPDAPRV